MWVWSLSLEMCLRSINKQLYLLSPFAVEQKKNDLNWDAYKTCLLDTYFVAPLFFLHEFPMINDSIRIKLYSIWMEVWLKYILRPGAHVWALNQISICKHIEWASCRLKWSFSFLEKVDLSKSTSLLSSRNIHEMLYAVFPVVCYRSSVSPVVIFPTACYARGFLLLKHPQEDGWCRLTAVIAVSSSHRDKYCALPPPPSHKHSSKGHSALTTITGRTTVDPFSASIRTRWWLQTSALVPSSSGWAKREIWQERKRENEGASEQIHLWWCSVPWP